MRASDGGVRWWRSVLRWPRCRACGATFCTMSDSQAYRERVCYLCRRKAENLIAELLGGEPTTHAAA